MVPKGCAGLDGQLTAPRHVFRKDICPSLAGCYAQNQGGGDRCTDGLISLARKSVQMGDLEKAVELLDCLKK